MAIKSSFTQSMKGVFNTTPTIVETPTKSVELTDFKKKMDVVFEARGPSKSSSLEINIDDIPGIRHDDPNYEMRKTLLTSVLTRNPELARKMKNWD